VAAGGAIWSALVLLLAALGLNLPNKERSSRIASHIFALSTLGLAATFYFAYASFFVLASACPICITMYGAVIGVFLVSASSAGTLGSALSDFSRDLGALQRSRTAVTLGVAWLAASVALVVFFPREQVVEASAGVGAQIAAPPIEPLSAEQLDEWTKWLDAQPRVDAMMPSGDTKVLMVKFNDYQCPSCRQTWALYKDIIERYEQAHPGVFTYESRDFPLETECGAGNAGHGAACEAAAAVRMAAGKDKKKEVEAALFAAQSPAMARDDVKKILREVAQISESEFDAQYPKVLEAVRADVQLGQRLGVTGTPTFFLNGIQISSLRPAYFDAAIAHMLQKAGA
jgi:protein-disulfide isomerase